ncbi:MAG TPA: c-type cytochrome [Ideonella sp.]|uniref:c-type cytochrome n=1 Tax=Ideonella sp. TaxID=1929293 RepID=UPI002E308C7C|nr:c-type cytochrome [Ideonella sp.]HEX5683815.1 c-type cytochrome [Ideonella sp.]
MALVLPACLSLAACGEAGDPGAAYRVVQDGQPGRGRVLLSRYQCGSCHAIPGAVSHSIKVGPSLDGFGRRSYIAGKIPNGSQNLQRWLQDPKALVPATTMPDVGVSPDDARDLAAYLLSLT